VVLRIGLVLAAMICWQGSTYLWEVGNTPVDGWSLGLMLGTYALSFVLLVVAFWRPLPRGAVWLIATAMGLVFFDFAQGHAVTERILGTVLTTDVQLFMDQAAALIRNGENPYNTDLRDAFRVYRAPMNFTTPLLDGDFTGRMPYPALIALLFVPFQWLGVPSVWVFPTFFAGCAALLWWHSDPTWRPLVLLPFFGVRHYLIYAYGGVSDTIWTFFLLLVIADWHRERARGIWYGLACAAKHPPWLLAPFLLVRLWNETEGSVRERVRTMARFSVLSIGTFLLVNLPFLIADPAAWLSGSLEPVMAAMVTYGQGWSSLTVTGWTFVPKGFHTAMLFALWAVVVFAYARNYRRFPEVMWVLPGLILWFGNRSLTSYWSYWAFPAVMALALNRQVRPILVRLPWDARNLRLSAVLVGGLLAAIVGGTALSTFRRPPLFVSVIDPAWTTGEHVWKMDVYVQNESTRVVQPRFRVQSRVGQPYFWDVHSGRSALRPGEGGVFTISTDAPHELVYTRAGAVLTVSDAQHQRIRGTARLEPDVSGAYPDAIPNGSFQFWNRETGVPTFWGLVSEPAGGGVVPLQSADGRARIALTLESTGSDERHTVRLDTYLLLPEDPIEVEVYVPPDANLPPDLSLAYGLDLVVGEHQVWVLFGDEAGSGEFAPGVHWWMVPVPREEWVVQQIRPREIFEGLGLPLPERLARVPRFYHLEIPVVPAHVQLLLSVEGEWTSVEAPFGRIRSTRLRPDPSRLFTRGRSQPELVELWLGDHNVTARNAETAREHYLRALELDPELGDAWVGLGRAHALARRYEEAIAAFLRAVQLNEGAAAAYKGIGWAQLELNDPVEALRSFDLAVSTFATSRADRDAVGEADAHLGRAHALAMLGRCREAVSAAETFSAMNPDHLRPASPLFGCDLEAAPSEMDLGPL
jgi:uncharacterized membrane protein